MTRAALSASQANSSLPPLLDHEIGMKRTGRLQRLKNRDQVAGRDPQCVESAGEFTDRYRLLDDTDCAALFGYTYLGSRHDHGLAVTERIGLGNLRFLDFGDRQVAVRDGDARKLDLLTGDDGARSFV